MAITRNQMVRREIPHEDGEWMEFRRLSWKQLDEISDAASVAALRHVKDLGPEILAGMRSAVRADGLQEQLRATESDPLNGYDLGALLRAGIVAWSYDEPFDQAVVDELDPVTAKWAGEAILEFAGISGRTEEERGEG